MKLMKLLIICLAVVLLSVWTTSAAPLQNPPPAIWCPGPGGIMALCSPLPTPIPALKPMPGRYRFILRLEKTP